MSEPGSAGPPVPPEARKRIALRTAGALFAFALAGAIPVLALQRSGRELFALSLALGLAVGLALSASWLAGTIACFHRSIGALQAATISLWPVRVGGVIAALVYADVRGLEKGLVLLGLALAHVMGQVLQGWSTGALADAARGVPAGPAPTASS